MVFSRYFTSNQKSSLDELCLDDAYEHLAHLGLRLRKAIGEREILSRDFSHGGEFRPPTFRSSAETLDQGCWAVYSERGNRMFVVPYQHAYESWKGYPHRHYSGFMAIAMHPYEYAYSHWDDWGHKLHPDLFDDGTFGVWLSLLPQPVNINFEHGDVAEPWWYCSLSWAAGEERVSRSYEMGRYVLKDEERLVSVRHRSWRVARAEAFVSAWEKMAANEPEDRYESIIKAEQERLKEHR